MAAANERRQDEPDLVPLAVDDGLDVGDETVGDLACAREVLRLAPADAGSVATGGMVAADVSRFGIDIVLSYFYAERARLLENGDCHRR